MKKSTYTGSGYKVFGGEGYLFRFEGFCINGLPEGLGNLKLQYEEYDGNFNKGAFNGYGKLKSYDGFLYEGDFIDCVKHGQGIQYFTPDITHRGTFASGVANGPGVLTKEYGRLIWKGNYENYLLEGEGEFIKLLHPMDIPNNPVCFSYKGGYKKGKAHGHGVQIEEDGLKYTGGFKHSLKHGKAEIITKIGDIFNGTYVDGTEEGVFTVKTITGLKWEILYQKGIQVTGIITYIDGRREKVEYDAQWTISKRVLIEEKPK